MKRQHLDPEADALWDTCAAAPPEPWKAAPTRREPKLNPWPGDTCEQIRERGTKVAFFDYEEATEYEHVYYLQDAFGAYPDFIISGSKLSDYWREVCKVPTGEPVLLVASAAIGTSKRNTSTYVAILEGPDVRHVRDTLTSHLNTFLHEVNRPIGFRERALRFKGKYVQHVRHCVFQHWEDWLMGLTEPDLIRGVDIKDVDDEEEMALILRFLYCPQLGFEGISATRPDGQLLRDALQREKEYLEAKSGPFLLISQGELKRIPHTIPQQSGVRLHKYIEHRLNPALGPGLTLREHGGMREQEDYDQVEAALRFFETNRISFLPENLERRMGSLLYKICGSLDAMELCADGTWRIWDWKRTPAGAKWAKNELLRARGQNVNASYAFSDGYIGYSLQAAAYRKLQLLEDPTKVIQTSSMLMVFCPLEESFLPVELNLAEPMSEAALKTMRGIADRAGEICVTPLSPIDYIEALFEKRLEHLCEYFGFVPEP
jgi:hypothetical protein